MTLADGVRGEPGPEPDGAERTPAPGAITALLAELARPPEPPRVVPALPGARLGRFTLVREIGRGGFGVVFEARDEALRREVALKLLAPRARAVGDRWVAEEAEAAAQLQHPNIVALFDVGSFEGSPYLVFELLQGETLSRRIARGPLPPDESFRIVEGVARGVAHAHARGVLHRDLTPSNVFLCEGGEVKVLDFGLSRLVGGATKRGGTPGHAPPEQERGEAEDGRTDVFALGVLAHQCATGELPGGPAAPPGWLAPVVARARRADPAARPPDGAAFLDELRRAWSADGRRGRQARRGALAAALLAGVAAGAWHSSAPRAGPLVLAVADVANETGEPDLDAISGLLVTSLEQSARVRVLTRTRLLDLRRAAGGDLPPRVDGIVARDAARTAGASVLLGPRIHRFEDAYVVEVEAVDPRRDERLFAERAQGRGKASVPALIDRVATRARLRLDERAPDASAAPAAVASAVTASLEAYRHYFRGQDLAARGRPRGAMEEYRQAVALDPSFTLARYELALAKLANVERRSEVREEVAVLGRQAARLPLKEALLLRALEAWSRGDLDGAVRRYDEVIARFPDEKQAPALAGFVLGTLAERPAEAIPYLERALALDPGLELALEELLRDLVVVGRGDEALERARRGVAEAPTSEDRHGLLGDVHLYRGELREAEASARRALALDRESTASWVLLENALLVQGDLDGLRAALEEEPASVRGRPTQALLATAEGRWRDARLALAASAGDAERVPRQRVMHLNLLAGIGPREEFVRHARRYVAEVEDGGAVALASALRGELELARDAIAASGAERSRVPRALADAGADVAAGRAPAAVRRLRELRPAGPYGGAGIAYALGNACLAAADDACAADAFRRFRSSPTHPVAYWRAWAYPLALLHEASARERLGERDDARALVDRLLAAWRHADPELPLLADARALRARLGEPRPITRAR